MNNFKTVFLIGNGFDLNLGLQTSYSHFYSYYKSLKSENPLIYDLKENINIKRDNWSDLEVALGNYTEKVQTQEDFEVVFEDLGDSLVKYLKLEEKNFNIEEVNRVKLIDHLAHPEDVLPNRDKIALLNFKEKWSNKNWDVNIATFNYTSTLEKILDFKGRFELSKHHSSLSINLFNIEHIHGSLTKDLVLGINDLSQLKNQDFRSNLDVQEAFIKPTCNQVLKHNLDEWCRSRILESNLICLFGSSIGETDRLWWELIGKRLKANETKLIIFSRGEDIPELRGYKRGRFERELKDFFLDRTDLKDKDRELAKSNIYIGVNTKMFDVWKGKKVGGAL